jgi:hypothetical protein
MFSPLHSALSYYEPCPKVGAQDLELRALHHQNWTARGWDHVELGRAEADRHPLAEPFQKMIASLPSINWPDYEIACWSRHLAVDTWFRENPHEALALAVDYDQFNAHLTPADLATQAAGCGITVITPPTPGPFGCFLLNRHVVSVLPTLMLEVAPREETWIHFPDGRKHVSDEIFMLWMLTWSHLAKTFVAQQVFDPTLLDDSDEARATRAQVQPLVHLSNASSRCHPTRPVVRAEAFAKLMTFFP